MAIAVCQSGPLFTVIQNRVVGERRTICSGGSPPSS